MGCGASSHDVPVIRCDEIYTWLYNNHLDMYHDKIVSERYDHPAFLYQASQEDLKLLADTVGMTESHKQNFLNLLLPIIILAKPVP